MTNVLIQSGLYVVRTVAMVS